MEASSVETAGMSTAFLIAIGVLYRILRQSNFQFSSSCRDRIVREATEDIHSRVREAVELEIHRSRATSPSHLGMSKSNSPRISAVAPRIQEEIPPLPPTP